MIQIITEELYLYENGFINGRAEAFVKICENQFELTLLQEDDWYSFGYNDAIIYYVELYLNNKTLFFDFFDNDIVIDYFIKRIIENNSKKNENIPMTKFIIR